MGKPSEKSILILAQVTSSRKGIAAVGIVTEELVELWRSSKPGKE